MNKLSEALNAFKDYVEKATLSFLELDCLIKVKQRYLTRRELDKAKDAVESADIGIKYGKSAHKRHHKNKGQPWYREGR